MPSLTLDMPSIVSPLEDFIRGYTEAIGGTWDEVEPRVYDLLLPPGAAGHNAESDAESSADGILRLAFDPDAIPEHPGAQLASFGTPLVDRLLAAAIERGRFARAYFNGLNLAPYDLFRRVRRALALPDGTELECRRVRPLDVPQAVYWFEATFVSDQKEQEVLSIGIDLGTGRQVRHLESLLDFSRLSEQPSHYLPEGRHRSAAAAYSTAREQVLRTLSSLANVRRRELQQRLERQAQRMGRYYDDLRGEIGEQIERAGKRGDDATKLQPRLEAIDREQRLRISELRQKSALAVRLRLIGLLVIQQPKLLIKATASFHDRAIGPAALDLVWDPLVEGLEAATCPRCQSPTYRLELLARRYLGCPGCKGFVDKPR